MLEETLADLKELLLGIAHEHLDVGLRNIPLHVGAGHLLCVTASSEGTSEADALHASLKSNFLRLSGGTSADLASPSPRTALFCP